MIEPVIERLTCDGNTERAHVGEVGQTQTAGIVLLAEDHVLFRAVERTPGIDTPLQRASDAGVELAMPPTQLVQHADHADAGRRLQDRNNLGVPIRREWIGPASPPRRFLLRWWARITLNPIRARFRESRLGRRGLGAQCLSVVHIQPHLVVGDVKARQGVDSSCRDKSTACTSPAWPPDGSKNARRR